jgi:ATP-dependent DNA helicase RecG
MKSEDIIKDILFKQESEQLEFKATVNNDSLAIAVCAFLNGSGGQILVGVKDDKTVQGVEQAADLARNLEKYLVNAIVPSAPIMVVVEDYEGRQLVLIEVSSGSRQPYIYKGSIYYRRNSRNVKASSDEISALIHQRQNDELHWERRSVLNAEVKDLDEREIKESISDVAKTGRGFVFADIEIARFLIAQNLLQNSNVTNAAVVLYGRFPTKFLPQCRVKISVFRDKTADKFLHTIMFEDNLFHVFDQVTSFFDVNISTQSRFNDKEWRRTDQTFPRFALREALLNALVHRDYANLSGSVGINFYEDRLEIANYGMLPSELKVSDLKINHFSLPRNPDIAQVCFLRGMIEKLGRGTIKILEDCKAKGLPTPYWSSTGGVTTVVFPGVTVVGRGNDGTSDGINDGIKSLITEALNKAISDGINEGTIDGITTIVKDELKRIMQLIADQPGINTNAITKVIGKSKPTIERYLSLLKQISVIERRGANKVAGYYMHPIVASQSKEL